MGCLRTISSLMSLNDRESQLELFDLANQPQARLRRESLGRFIIHLRYDQAILLSIGCLLALTVIFAGGVERGKLLVRSENLKLARQIDRPQTLAPAVATSSKTDAKAAEVPKEDKPSKASSSRSPATPQKAKQRTRIAEAPAKSQSRYAIQLATYSRPQLAKNELTRLQAKGVSAFLIIREGRTVVYAGPFPSKGDAGDTLASLKVRYQDCFIKSL